MKQAWKDRRNFDDKRRTKDGDIRPGRAGLTGEVHPPRIIADFLAVQEHVETPLNRAAYAFLGDACQDMYRRLLTCGAKLLMDLRLCATDALWAANSIAAAPKIMVRRTGE